MPAKPVNAPSTRRRLPYATRRKRAAPPPRHRRIGRPFPGPTRNLSPPASRRSPRLDSRSHSPTTSISSGTSPQRCRNPPHDQPTESPAGSHAPPPCASASAPMGPSNPYNGGLKSEASRCARLLCRPDPSRCRPTASTSSRTPSEYLFSHRLSCDTTELTHHEASSSTASTLVRFCTVRSPITGFRLPVPTRMTQVHMVVACVPNPPNPDACVPNPDNLCPESR